MQLIATGAAADEREVATGPDSVTVRDFSHATGTSGSTDRSTPVYRDCVDTNLILSGIMSGFDAWTGNSTDITTTSSVAWRTCYRIDSGQEVGWATGIPGATADEDPTAALVDQARATIVIDVPDVELSPPHGGIQLVGVPVWVWSNNHQPVSVTASIPTLSATLTATPGDIQVDLGDGTRFTCRGGGVPYDPGVSHRGQSTDCSEAYERHGPHTITVTVVWSLTWTATNGQAGTLPAVTRTTALDLDVQQAQAVTS